MTETTDWLEFKAMRDQRECKPCPFCGIRHDPGKTHPYCTEATSFRAWRAAGKRQTTGSATRPVQLAGEG